MHLKIVRGLYLIAMIMTVFVFYALTQTQGGAGSGKKPDQEQSFQGYVVKTYSDLDNGPGKFEVYKNGKFIFTFAYVYTDFAESPAPTIILRFQDDHYVLAEDLMRKPAPPASEIESKVQEIRKADSWQQKSPPVDLWAWMIELIYTGQAKLAWRVYGQAWPETVPGKEDSLNDFQSHLSQSPYWPQIKKMNGL